MSTFLFVVFAFLLFCGSYVRPEIQFQRAKEELNRVANLIYHRFEYNNSYRYQFFLGSSNMGTFTWDLLKYKFALRMVQSNSTFLMIFGGSSVTAGHDNYHHQAYPQVFERRMTDIFKALGIKLIVHNTAMGANNCRPYAFCYLAQGGLPGVPIDWINWEQSFNCGRDAGVFELMARIAYFHKAIFYISASGAFYPDACKPSTDAVPYIAEAWTPEIANITDKYEIDAVKVKNYKKLLNEWYEDGNSVARFTDPLRNLYRGVGHHGYSVWGHSKTKCVNDLKNMTVGCTAIDVAGFCHSDNGPHWMVHETAEYGSGKKSSHHPPAGMHLMRAETLAYQYSHILADALAMVEQDSATKSTSQLAQKYQNELSKLLVPIPDAKTCSTSCHCRKDCETLPVCYTNYEPHFNPNYTLNEILVGKTTWSHVFKVGVGPDPGRFGYKDNRLSYELRIDRASNLTHTELYLKVNVSNRGIVIICGYSVKESLKNAIFRFDFNVNADARSLHHYTTSPGAALWTNRHYQNDECTILENIPEGNHILIVSANPNVTDAYLSVSHVITFAAM